MNTRNNPWHSSGLSGYIPAVHPINPIGILQSVVFVGDHENRFFLFMGIVPERRQHQAGVLIVQITGGLVGKQDFRLLRERADNR